MVAKLMVFAVACCLQLLGIRSKMAVVLSKTKNDDKLIAALRAEAVYAKEGGAPDSK